MRAFHSREKLRWRMRISRKRTFVRLHFSGAQAASRNELFLSSFFANWAIAIAQQRGAKVVQFEFNGTWPKKKNWALENLQFRNEWVFVLDADEVLPPEAETEFAQAIADGGDIAGQSSFYVHGKLAAAWLLSQLGPAPFSARPRPL